MNLQIKTETIVIILVAIICVAISVLDFIDALDSLPWISNRIPVIVLLTLGLLSLFVVSNRNIVLKKLEVQLGVQYDRILGYLTPNEDSQIVLNAIDRIWSSREEIIRQIFEKAAALKKSRDHEYLKTFLQTRRRGGDRRKS